MTDTQLARRGEQQAIEQQAPRGLTLEMVVEMTGFQPAQIALISKTVAQGAPLQELAMFLHACHELRLDPLLRQAYWIRRKSREQVNGQWVDVYKGTLQVGIDGFRALADRQGNYAGSEPPTFSDWTTIVTDRHETIDVPGRAQVRVWKIVQGRSCCFTGEANWSEFYPGPGPTGQMYRKMPRHMLAKDAEAQALRKGWPALLGSMAMNSAIGDEVESGPIGVPATTITEQPAARAQQVTPQATPADYDRIIGSNYDDDPAQGRAPAPATPPPAAAETEPEDAELLQVARERNESACKEAEEIGVKGVKQLRWAKTDAIEDIERKTFEAEERTRSRNNEIDASMATQSSGQAQAF
jgi:phage recombination protein Bet